MFALLTLLSIGVTNLLLSGDHSMLLLGHTLATILANAHTLLAPGGGAAHIETAVNNLVETLKAVGRPIAILGLVLLALSWMAAGVLPDWAQQNKGVLVKMLMGGILLGIAPDVVGLVLPS